MPLHRAPEALPDAPPEFVVAGVALPADVVPQRVAFHVAFEDEFLADVFGKRAVFDVLFVYTARVACVPSALRVDEAFRALPDEHPVRVVEDLERRGHLVVGVGGKRAGQRGRIVRDGNELPGPDEVGTACVIRRRVCGAGDQRRGLAELKKRRRSDRPR